MSAMPSEQTDFLVGNKSSGHHVRSRRWHPRSAAACWTGVTGALHRGLEASLQHAERSRRVPQQRPNPLQTHREPAASPLTAAGSQWRGRYTAACTSLLTIVRRPLAAVVQTRGSHTASVIGKARPLGA